MGNPVPNFKNLNVQNGVASGLSQVVSDTKFSTRTYAAGVAPPQTVFFNTAAVADPTLDNYDAGNQLVTSSKQFMIEALSVNISGGAVADVDAMIQRGVLVLTAQQKECGRFRLRHLNAGGGTYASSAQIAAASVIGVTNGLPHSDVWRIIDLLIQTNQTFYATLLMPITTPYTITTALTVELDLIGYEIRPTA